MPTQYCISCGGATRYLEGKPKVCSKCGKSFNDQFDALKAIAANLLGNATQEAKASQTLKHKRTDKQSEFVSQNQNPHQRRLSLAELGVHIAKPSKNIVGKSFGFGGTSLEDDQDLEEENLVLNESDQESQSDTDEQDGSDEFPISQDEAEDQILQAIASKRIEREVSQAISSNQNLQSIPSEAVLKENNGKFIPRRFDVGARRALLSKNAAVSELKTSETSTKKSSKSKKICSKPNRHSKTKQA